MVRWVTYNHPGRKLKKQSIVVSRTLTDDYKDHYRLLCQTQGIIDKLNKGTTTQRKKRKNLANLNQLHYSHFF